MKATESAPSHNPTRLITACLVLFLSACASLPDDVQRTASYAIADIDGTRLHSDLQDVIDANPDKSGFYTLMAGEDAFITRWALIQQADRTLDMQYYIWHQDLTGSLMMHQLAEAARRGVRVRLLLDDLDTAGKDPTLRVLDAMDNLEIRVFNPFANRDNRLDDMLTDTARINHRMHNKTLTADGIATIFGGRNIGDEYFAADSELFFSDMDALAVGPIAAEVGSQFDLYWNSRHAYPIGEFYDDLPTEQDIEYYHIRADAQLELARRTPYAAAVKQMKLAQTRHFAELNYNWSDWVLAYDLPEKADGGKPDRDVLLAPKLKEGLDAAEEDLLIISPYFIPGEEFTDYLIQRVADGVRVRILTNSLLSNDVPAVHAGYIRYRQDLVEGGVELYELRADLGERVDAGSDAVESEKSSLHAKFMVFDERWLWVGSYNIDGRSTIYNTELGAYFVSAEDAAGQSKNFDEQIIKYAFRVELDDDGNLQWVTRRDGVEEVLDEEPDTTWLQRVTTGTLKLIVPEKLF
ncbi:hypothetical protein A3709_04705 [Halioglobus sp. HI00S01]|uniref:phospholipase D family protein n=1 Tax=Halioglobus sp. HI00S01 TaxID=1822214 RepID=UPI0007C3899D|nr:phospholipase D family protein [Halioglobus sp. HI00S01]KZX57069.1 hypothetical protein A3709_04705 [Halioglobus sp. HI00S01]